MTRAEMRKNLSRNTLLSMLALLPLLAFTDPAWAILGVWRRTAVAVAVVGTTEAEGVAAASANASKQAAATAQAQSAADASAAAAKQSAAAAQQAAAGATAATAKTPQQKLQELQSLYDQKLISQSDYEAGKQKILSGVTN